MESRLLMQTGPAPRVPCPHSLSLTRDVANARNTITPIRGLSAIGQEFPSRCLQLHRARYAFTPSIKPMALDSASDIQLDQPRDVEGTQTLDLRFLSALYRFTRPHTMLGTLVSVVSVSSLAASLQPSTQALVALLQALSSALLMNVCIVGINQIYDVEIDKLNKPYLPLAAGDFTSGTATLIVWFTGAAATAIGIASGSTPLLVTLIGSLLLGIAYSTDLPMLRWKQHPVAAAACILAVRAVLVQLGFYFHMQRQLGEAQVLLTGPVLFATGFMLIFSIVIALMKDIPDVLGDTQAGVRTLSVRLGKKRVFWLCIGLLELAYGGAVAALLLGSLSEIAWSRALGAIAHAVVGALIWLRAARTNLEDATSIYACYMDVWKAFYLEYLFLPLLR